MTYDAELSAPVELQASCQFESSKAIRVWVGEIPGWIPKRHILPESEVKHRGDVGTLVIPAWLAADKRWRWIDAK